MHWLESRIPNPPPEDHHQRSFVSVGCNIYAIGKLMPSTNVSILDCRSHTWHEAPSMCLKRNHPEVNVFDGKIYVAGGCDYNYSNWMEVFDPKTQTWEHVLTPLVGKCKSYIHINKSAVINRDIYMVNVGDQDECMAYKPKEERWEEALDINVLDLGWSSFSYCVIDNVLYSYNELDGIKWYDSKIRCWRHLMGLETLPKFDYSLTRPILVDYGGKMAVFWDKDVASRAYEIRDLCCVVIILERRNNQEIWGKIEWCEEEILEISRKYSCLHALAATV